MYHTVMAEFIVPPVAFKTMYEKPYVVGVTTEWGVMYGDNSSEGFKLQPEFLPPEAVLIFGFLSSIDTLQLRSEFYASVLSSYDRAVRETPAPSVYEIEIARNGTNLGGRLNRVRDKLTSPFNTTILPLEHGTKKFILSCSNPSDDELVKNIITTSIVSDVPAVNAKIQARLITDYMYRKELKLRHLGYVGRNATDTTSASSDSETQVDENVFDYTSAVSDISVPEFIDRSAVVKTTGAHVLGSEAGTSFSQEELARELGVRPLDEPGVRTVFVALQRAGFVTPRKVNGDTLIYVRTSKKQ